MQRRFLRKRGAVGRSAFSVGQNAIACYLWSLSTRNPFRENPPVFLHCKLQWFYAEHTQHNTGAHPIAALQNKKAIAFAFLHQRWLRIGAADEARTRYLHLGKVALYQMSYGRISGAFIPAPSRAILANFGAPAKVCEAKFCGEKEKVLHDFRRGASDRNRTNDTGIFSPLLYRLSYRGKYDPDRARTDDPQRDRLVL